MKIEKIFQALFLFFFVLSPVVWADTDPLALLTQKVELMQKEMNEMRGIIKVQEEKIRELEIKGPSERPQSMTDEEFDQRLSTALGGSSKWLKDLKFGGDLRLRYEGFQQTSGHPSETDDRNRFRFRLRYGFEKKLSDEWKVGFSMNSGEQSAGTNVDPTATNISFDHLFSFKDIFIEKAYATYTPGWARRGPVEKLELTGGKAANPFETGSSEIVWDRDVRPEGVYERFNFNLLKTEGLDLKAYALAGQYVLDEDATTGGDSNLFAFQMGVNPVLQTPFLEKPVDILQAVSFYDFDKYAANNNFLIGTTSLARGNPNVSGATNELDARDFKIIESYSELALYPNGFPTRIFFDTAVNPASRPIGSQGGTVLHQDFAWALGTKLGNLSKKGDWELKYDYRYIGANAVVGAFNDSDFGLGSSGKQGHVFKLGYQLAENVTLSGAAMFVDNLNGGTAGIRDEQQRRFQLDLAWKF